MKKKVELIFVPVPVVGHLVSTIEFAKRLINQNDQLLITILVFKISITTASFADAYTKSLTASQPNIRLIDLPLVDLPSLDLFAKSIESYVCAAVESYKPHIRRVVMDIMLSRSNSDSVPVAGIVLDLFCVSMMDIGDEFDLPSFIFFTCNARFLSFMLHLPSRHEQLGTEFSFSDPDFSVKGFLNPVPTRVLPGAVFNKDGGYAAFIKLSQRFRDASGILVNTFTEVESYALDSLNNNNSNSPKVYPVGPVLNLKGQPHPDMDHARWDKIMKWLDEQPESSVVFLCFGSSGTLTASQVKEMALGLERSGHKFLWSLRFGRKEIKETEFENPEDMLPEGFLERVEGRGIVCGWTPQVEVLAHKAIGGFLSHCGWNSILESLWCGVPIVTLPLYAEQQFNAFVTVKELGLAVELKMDYRPISDVVTAEEVERTLTCVMECNSEVRKKVKDKAEMARKAVKEGGSSFNSISQFIDNLIQAAAAQTK